jgi:ABC-type multidrug transport system ATPase subunit
MFRVMIVIGMLEPTSGHVTVEGLDNQTNIQDVRRILGFCPQYGKKKTLQKELFIIYFIILDILYKELSVEEHLDLIGKVMMNCICMKHLVVLC